MVRSDSELVQAVLRGDRQAFAVLYDRYARLIRVLCRDHTPDAHAAADLGQEVFLRAYRRLGSLSDHDRFGAWLVAIARNVCLEWVRSRRRPGPSIENSLLVDQPTADAPIDSDLESAERLALLRDALARLPERERTALHAFYVQGLGVERVGELLGVSRSGLYHVLAVARRRLVALLRRQEVRP